MNDILVANARVCEKKLGHTWEFIKKQINSSNVLVTNVWHDKYEEFNPYLKQFAF